MLRSVVIVGDNIAAHILINIFSTSKRGFKVTVRKNIEC
jgi:hypothetical protein